MEITDIKVHTLSIDEVEAIGNGTQDAAIIEVETDEGISGIGEADSSPAVVKAIVEAPMSHMMSMGLKEILIGRDPFQVEKLWHEMFEGTYFFGRKGGAITAISAIDMALWDIRGKATGKPLYELLGGKHRESVRAYASTLFPEDPNNLDHMRTVAKNVLDDGFSAVKFGWGGFGQDISKDDKLVGAARDVLGPDIDLMIDVGMVWNTDIKRAIKEINTLDDTYNLYWVEEPVKAENLNGYAQISDACQTRIVGGENEFTADGFRDLLDCGNIDTVQPDVARSGGVTHLHKIASMAKSRGIPFVPHGFSTDIIIAANLHLIAAHPNAPLLEYCIEDSPLRWDTVNESFPVEEGQVTIPDRPGLGITLNHDIIDTYRINL